MFVVDDDCKLGRFYQEKFCNMEYCGRVLRTFKAKSYDWDVDFIREFALSEEPNAAWLDDYLIVRKNIEGAYNALLRFDSKDFVPNDYHWTIAGNWMEKHFTNAMGMSEVFDYDTIREYMVDDTAPGFPMSIQHRTKASYLDSDDGDFYQCTWDLLATDEPILSFDSCSVKVELRPREKVLTNYPRSIMVVCTNMTTSGQRLFLDQNIKMNESAGMTSACVGIDPMRGGWNRLANRMSVKPHSFALDGKWFDSRYHNRAQDNICRLRKRLLAPRFRTVENEKRIDNFYSHKKKSFFVQVDGRIFKRDTGESSGNSNTVNDNTLKCYQDACVLWLILTPPKYHHYETFCAHVDLCIVGDDWNFSVTEECLEYYNARSIIEVQSQIGMVYTTDCLDPRPFTETTFLSAGFCRRKFGSLELFLPVLDCIKTKCSMIHGNEHKDIFSIIQRLGNMRVISFGCQSCTLWLEKLADFIKRKYADDPVVRTPAWANSWSGWLTEQELVRLYTGMESLPVRDFKFSPRDFSALLHFDTLTPFALSNFYNAPYSRAESSPKRKEED